MTDQKLRWISEGNVILYHLSKQLLQSFDSWYIFIQIELRLDELNRTERKQTRREGSCITRYRSTIFTRLAWGLGSAMGNWTKIQPIGLSYMFIITFNPIFIIWLDLDPLFSLCYVPLFFCWLITYLYNYYDFDYIIILTCF